jgi:pyrroline-5-carboxylate reductase
MAFGKNIALIGAGNLGGALLAGLLESKAATPDSLYAADADSERLKQLRDELGLTRSGSVNAEAVAEADVIIIAVKPPIVAAVLADIRERLTPQQLVVSLAAAVPIRSIEQGLPDSQPLIRAMPNIAMTVHAAATALCANAHAGEEHLRLADEIFSTVGVTVFVNEAQMHAVTALSGSGPAYVFTLLEGLIAGGVKMGLPTSTATTLAVQTFLGAAKLVQESDEHPAVLRDLVTTPGGTTIAGLHAMESANVRAAMMDAVEAATARSSELERLLYPAD